MSNDLTRTAPQNAALSVLAGFSPGLKSLLELGDTASAIEQIVASPVMLSEAKAGLPALLAVATAPAGAPGVQRVLAKALVLYRLDMSEPEWVVWWREHIDLLGDLPEHVLEAGMRAHKLTADAEFMPKPGKLRELSMKAINPLTRMADRAKAAVRQGEPPPEMVTPASRESVQRMMEDYRTKVSRPAHLERKPPLPTPVAVDEGGLSQAMRKRMAG